MLPMEAVGVMVSRITWPPTPWGKMGKKMSADHALLPLNPWQSCEVDAVDPILQTKLKLRKVLTC